MRQDHLHHLVLDVEQPRWSRVRPVTGHWSSLSHLSVLLVVSRLLAEKQIVKPRGLVSEVGWEPDSPPQPLIHFRMALVLKERVLLENLGDLEETLARKHSRQAEASQRGEFQAGVHNDAGPGVFGVLVSRAQ